MNWEFNHARPQNGKEVIALRKAVRSRLFDPQRAFKAKQHVDSAQKERRVLEPYSRPLWKRFAIRFDAHEYGRAAYLAKMASPKRMFLMGVLEEIGYTLDEVMSKSRKRRISLARMYCIWRLRREFGTSYPEIGRLLGLDHSSAIHADRRVQKMIDQGLDPLA